MGPGTSDYILGVIRTRWSLVTILAVCLGGGLRSLSAFLVFLMLIWDSGNMIIKKCVYLKMDI